MPLPIRCFKKDSPITGLENGFFYMPAFVQNGTALTHVHMGNNVPWAKVTQELFQAARRVGDMYFQRLVKFFRQMHCLSQRAIAQFLYDFRTSTDFKSLEVVWKLFKQCLKRSHIILLWIDTF